MHRLHKPILSLVKTATTYKEKIRAEKAWLCAGSLLGKLAKKGLTRWECKRDGTNRGYSLTSRGIEAIKEYEKNRSKERRFVYGD